MCKRGENIYKRKDGRWEGRLQINKGKCLYYYGKSYSDVKEKKNELIKKAILSSDATMQNYVATKAVTEWLNQCEGRVKLSTYENYYYCVSGYIIPFFERSKNDVFTANQLKNFSNYICEKTNLSLAYQRKIFTIFKVAIRSIFRETKIQGELLEALTPPKIHAKPVEAFSIQEQRKIEEQLYKSGENRALGILLCFYTGLRLGELGALRWEDIDLDSKTLSVKRTLTRIKNFESKGCRTSLIVSSPKNRTSIRKIPIPEFLVGELYSHIGINKSCFVLTDSLIPADPRSYQRYYKKVLEKANVTYRKFHTIRHTFATRILEMGIDIKTISELLGHSSVINTLNIYAHSLMEQKKHAIAKLNLMHMRCNDSYAVKES